MLDTETDLKPVELEMELLDHLGVPESALALHKQRFSSDFIDREADKHYEFCYKVFEWTMEFIDKYQEAPDQTVFLEEFPEYRFAEPTWNIDYLIEKFRERYRYNTMNDVVLRLGRAVRDDPAEAVRLGLAEFHRIAAITQDRKSVISLSDWREELERYKEKVERGAHIGYTFGWDRVDEILGGIRPGCLYFVIGRPKRYKSWFLLKSAVKAAMNGNRVAFHTLEMGQEEMFQRAMCMFSGVSWGAFRDGMLEPPQIAEMESRMAFWEDKGFYMFRPPVGERSAAHLLSASQQVEADFVVVDQLKFIESPRANARDARHQKVEYVCEDLKEASHRLPFYVACQFNREAANLAEMADLSKIGLSDAIGQTADMLLGLHQTKEFRKEHLIQFGTIESRSFEHALFEVDTYLMERKGYTYLEPVRVVDGS